MRKLLKIIILLFAIIIIIISSTAIYLIIHSPSPKIYDVEIVVTCTDCDKEYGYEFMGMYRIDDGDNVLVEGSGTRRYEFILSECEIITAAFSKNGASGTLQLELFSDGAHQVTNSTTVDEVTVSIGWLSPGSCL